MFGRGRPRFEFLDLAKRNQDFVQIVRSSRLIQMVASLDEGLIAPTPSRSRTWPGNHRSFARRASRGPRAPSHNGSPRRVSGSVSGQRSNDRGERVGRAGAEDEVGVADLLPSPLDFLGCRRRVSGEYGQ